MKAKYYINFFSFISLICITYFLLGACSKLAKKLYPLDEEDKKVHSIYSSASGIVFPNDMYLNHDIEGEGYTIDSQDYNSPPYAWTQQLFKAIEGSDIGHVERLLKDLSCDPEGKWVDQITSFAPRDMCTCLHIVAAMEKPEAVGIMQLLLDKMAPLLLDKKGREGLLNRKYKFKLEAYVKGNRFWNQNQIEIALNGLEFQGYNTSVLLWTNHLRETPLLIAAKRGGIEMFTLLLEYTHKCVGLDHTAHIDQEENDKENSDFFDVLLAQEDDTKLSYLILELTRCSDRYFLFPCMHFSGFRCKSEGVIRAIGSSKKKLELLFRAVHNNKLERVYLVFYTIGRVLGPVDCLKVFIKEYRSSNYTLLHTALDKNLLEEEDEATVAILTYFLLSTIEVMADHLPVLVKQKLMALLSKAGTEDLDSLPNPMDLAQKHMCKSSLSDLYKALRIIIEFDTPPPQLWPLYLDLPKRGGCKRKKEASKKKGNTLPKRLRKAS